MEKIPSPNIDPPPNLINLKYVNICNCKLHTVSRSVLPFTLKTVCSVPVQQQLIYISQISFVNKKVLPKPLTYKLELQRNK